jgi:hypothetical protein
VHRAHYLHGYHGAVPLMAPDCTVGMDGSVHEPVHGRGAVSDHPVTVCNIAESIGLTSAANGGTVWRALMRVSSATHLMRLTWEAGSALRRVVPVSTSSADSDAGKAAHPGLSVTQLLAAKGTRPIRSLDELAADTFESDEELEEFLTFTYAERHRDLA